MSGAYSTDDDLRKHLSSGNYAVLPLPLTDLHEEAGRQVDATLRAQGWSADDLLILTDETLVALREASALNVLAMFFRRFDDAASIERSDRYGAEYRRQMTLVPVNTTSGDTTDASSASGYVVLG